MGGGSEGQQVRPESDLQLSRIKPVPPSYEQIFSVIHTLGSEEPQEVTSPFKCAAVTMVTGWADISGGDAASNVLKAFVCARVC